MSVQGKNTMAAFLNADLEPATRTLDGVRLVFHYCNFVNLTLGAVAFGVGIGYDLTDINVSGEEDLRPVETQFLVVGLFVILHGLIGTYGFVSKQSRSLIIYGCMGLCLLIVGSLASGKAVTGRNSIPDLSRDHFYHGYIHFLEKINTSYEGDTVTALKVEGINVIDVTDDDQFIWDIMYVEKFCRMPENIAEELDLADNANKTVETQRLNEYEEYHVNHTVCYEDSDCTNDTTDTDNYKVNCINGTYCKNYTEPILCLKYVKILSKNRIVTMYVTLFLLATTQSVCLTCDILFIFWSLKEEADIERHKTAAKNEDKRCSSKLQLLGRLLPCCIKLPEPNFLQQPRDVPLCDISDGDELSSSPQRSGSNKSNSNKSRERAV